MGRTPRNSTISRFDPRIDKTKPMHRRNPKAVAFPGHPSVCPKAIKKKLAAYIASPIQKSLGERSGIDSSFHPIIAGNPNKRGRRSL